MTHCDFAFSSIHTLFSSLPRIHTIAGHQFPATFPAIVGQRSIVSLIPSPSVSLESIFTVILDSALCPLASVT